MRRLQRLARVEACLSPEPQDLAPYTPGARVPLGSASYADWSYEAWDLSVPGEPMNAQVERISLIDPSLRQIIVAATPRTERIDRPVRPVFATEAELYFRSLGPSSIVRRLPLPPPPCNEHVPCPQGLNCSAQGPLRAALRLTLPRALRRP